VEKEPDICNLAFANFVFQLRWLKQLEARPDLLLSGARLKHMANKHPSLRPGSPELAKAMEENRANLLKHRLDVYHNIKVMISRQLHDAAIVCRPEMTVISRHFLSGHHIYAITTNWDRGLDRYFDHGPNSLAEPVLHLHGHEDRASSLYLPTEMTLETYRPEASV